MPSLRALGLGLLLLLQVVNATPVEKREASAACGPTSTSSAVSTATDPPTAVLPLTGGPTELPSTNLTLAFVALGRGVQNYTCSGTGAPPVQLGANAILYIATAEAEADVLDTVPPWLVYQTIKPGGYIAHDGYHYDPLGVHYFDAAGTPTFNLTTIPGSPGKFLTGHMAKKDAVNAPTNATVGPDGTGAVPWLYLTNKTGYTSDFLAVYRVVTAGGNPYTNCTDSKMESIPYAAEYWFYT